MGMTRPKSVRDATALWAHECHPKAGRPTTRSATEEVVVVEEEGDAFPSRQSPYPFPQTNEGA